MQFSLELVGVVPVAKKAYRGLKQIDRTTQVLPLIDPETLEQALEGANDAE